MPRHPDRAGLWRITAPRFVAGLVIVGRHVSRERSDVAPILRRFSGVTYQWLAETCRNNGWKLERIAP